MFRPVLGRQQGTISKGIRKANAVEDTRAWFNTILSGGFKRPNQLLLHEWILHHGLYMQYCHFKLLKVFKIYKLFNNCFPILNFRFYFSVTEKHLCQFLSSSFKGSGPLLSNRCLCSCGTLSSASCFIYYWLCNLFD